MKKSGWIYGETRSINIIFVIHLDVIKKEPRNILGLMSEFLNLGHLIDTQRYLVTPLLKVTVDQ